VHSLDRRKLRAKKITSQTYVRVSDFSRFEFSVKHEIVHSVRNVANVELKLLPT
jgi:hypothetical protein